MSEPSIREYKATVEILLRRGDRKYPIGKIEYPLVHEYQEGDEITVETNLTFQEYKR